ncbi:dipicolinate synthase subunit B [Acetanaerobacterium elongatum]|uniref:Dipicolinate synthase subunit B n=1 Tax=Acetanaerobacterium elongatum TaxID=258515 RepID=A0A1G9WK54_9FIRM|nr:dipicolinate synthase subunit B [Acetanaerobacterium elongatum]SDM84972.1 dipicolinate synthase subunit B [Acetanaerobacterium elongatum]
MKLEGLHIGVGLTGSFCTFDKVITEIEKLVNEEKAIVHPILSDATQTIDTRFGTAEDYIARITKITGNKPVTTIEGAEPLGPNNVLDILLIAPCTGNTAAKLVNAITDTPVLMAAKGHLRGGKPLVIALSSNDALGFNFKNIGQLLNSKNIYFVPFGQDNYKLKPNSMIAHMNQIIPTLEQALDRKQIQPVIQSPH